MAGAGSSKWCLGSSSSYSSAAAGAAASPLLSPSLSSPPPPFYHHRPPPATERSPRAHLSASRFPKEAGGGGEKKKLKKKKTKGKPSIKKPPPPSHPTRPPRETSRLSGGDERGFRRPQAGCWEEARAPQPLSPQGRGRACGGSAGACAGMGRVQVAKRPLRSPPQAPSRPRAGW